LNPLRASTRGLIEAAHDYLSRGLRVIALTDKMPNGKVHRKGIYDCLTGETPRALLNEAFAHPKTTGIGILTGFPLYVVDIDGEEGARTYHDLVAGEISYTPTATTGRGMHLYFMSEHDFPTQKLGEKLDFKGAGGYVAAPPSRHPSGHTYEWIISPAESAWAELPYALRGYLLKASILRGQRLITKEANRRVPHKALEDGQLWNTGFSIAGPIRKLQETAPGERNAMLFWAACTILEDGASEDEMEELYDAALACGLDTQESKRTIQSAVKRIGA
jgi:hypothetical protein